MTDYTQTIASIIEKWGFKNTPLDKDNELPETISKFCRQYKIFMFTIYVRYQNVMIDCRAKDEDGRYFAYRYEFSQMELSRMKETYLECALRYRIMHFIDEFVLIDLFKMERPKIKD